MLGTLVVANMKTRGARWSAVFIGLWMSHAGAQSASPSPLLAIDQHRATVIERIVAEWGDKLAAANAGVGREQLREMLSAMRADQLLAASLAGSLAGLHDVVAQALVAPAPISPLIRTKALGDASDDLVYTPVTPCRLVETRGTFAAVYQGDGTPAHNPLPYAGGQTRDYSVLGGNSVCLTQLPAGLNPVAVQLQVFGIPLSSATSGDIEILPQGSTFGSTATLIYLGSEPFVSASATAKINTGNNQVGVQVRGGGANLAMDVVGYFRSPGGGNISIPGNLVLSESTSAGAGNVYKASKSFIHNFGPANTFVGETAGNFTMTGGDNAAFGYGALNANTTGASNTAAGVEALFNNTTGTENTAVGDAAMLYNTTGASNTAVGFTALYTNDSGSYNIALGDGALFSNNYSESVAIGYQSMYASTGGSNVAIGWKSLYGNGPGSANTAIGNYTLANITTGVGNIALGYGAGQQITSGYNNIEIYHQGLPGDTNTIRLGDSAYQNRTFIAGIRAITPGVANGIPVYIDSNNQLGTVSSSRSVKDDITDMGEQSSLLMQLRPVTFYYKADQDPSGRTLQYGLVAEEVEEVAPGLVARKADGDIETVYYQFLPPMLLNEYQKQQRMIEAQAAAIRNQASEIAFQTASIAELRHDRATQASEIDDLKRRAVETAAATVAHKREVAELRRAVEVLMARTAPEGQIAAVR
jgi:hypothetical protein